MEWLHPIGHLAWIGVIVVIALLVSMRSRQRRDRQRFGDEETVHRLSEHVDSRRRRMRAILLTAGVALLAVSLAGPRFGTTPREVHRSGLDLVVALDVSASMLAEDVAPNRLERARHELKKLADELHGDRMALVIFAGDAFLQMPLTSDRNAFRMFLDVAAPDQIPTPGTDFSAMLAMVSRAFTQHESADDVSRVLLIVSDGENHSENLDAAVREIASSGVEIFSVGIGERQGARIPVRVPGRATEYRRNGDGEFVRTRLEDAILKQISGANRYFEIGRTSNTFQDFPRALEQLQRTEMEVTVFEDFVEWYQWPLLLALILLLAERVLPDRRSEKRQQLQSTA